VRFGMLSKERVSAEAVTCRRGMALLAECATGQKKVGPVGGALTTEAVAATSPTCPSGALASASVATFIPLSETVLSTTEAVVCGVSGQAKEVLKENATASMLAHNDCA
jgi:hypothetical protein